MEDEQAKQGMEIRALKKWFPVRTGLLAAKTARGNGAFVRAVDGVDMVLGRGEVVGIAGGSGSGKSTLGMTMLRLYEPTSGALLFGGRDLTKLSPRDMKQFRRNAQIVFQDPYASLNPRFTVLRTVMEPLIVYSLGDRTTRLQRVSRALELVELTPPELFLPRYPHELSGGQMQRVCIARAMVLEPQFLVADEPVSMLDVSIRAGILELLRSLVNQYNLTILYVSHDLAGMAYLCDKIHIMYRGRIIETAPARKLVTQPRHPYTQALIAAVPTMETGGTRQRRGIDGEAHGIADVPQGCRFRNHCLESRPNCAGDEPELQQAAPGHHVACYLNC